METGLPSLADGKGVAALKPSLVEWKLERGGRIALAPPSLETFLGGMETSKEPDPVIHSFPSLETFLGGMETLPDALLIGGGEAP